MERPLKVVITAAWAQRLGGAENMLWTFLRHVDRARVEPVVVFFEAGPFEREVASLGIRTAVVQTGRLREAAQALNAVRQLAVVLRREQPHLLLNWMPKAQLYGAAAATLAGMRHRVVWWQHGIPSNDWLDRVATLFPTRAVGCSSHTSARAQDRLRPRRVSFVVHPGIDDLSGIEADAATIALPSNRIVVGIVGRLQPWKRQDSFVRALSLLVERGADVHGLIVGGNAWNLSPGFESFLRRLVDDLGLRGRIAFTGQVPDARPYIGVMDVLVNASDHEPFGIVLLEAMAAGVAVVATGGAGPSEIIEHGVSGFLVASSDPALLADAIAPLIADDELRRRVATAGRTHFEGTFTAERMTNDLQEQLENLSSY